MLAYADSLMFLHMSSRVAIYSLMVLSNRSKSTLQNMAKSCDTSLVM